MIVRHRFRITRAYFITALAYHAFQYPEQSFSKKQALSIVRARLYWSGIGNFHGDRAIHEELGDEHTDRFNDAYEQVKQWVKDNFPELK